MKTPRTNKEQTKTNNYKNKYQKKTARPKMTCLGLSCPKELTEDGSNK